MTEYNHNWPSYMPAKALALTAVNIFLDTFESDDSLAVQERADAAQILYDELCGRVGEDEARNMIFYAPGMDKNLCKEFTELVE